ncbi:MAG: hypothetical protein COA74_01440 [Gammaproteobacteria bacterium]|nr:MAG: hypothetical protein COA74_01440 [Gammaproteobacteria bacterium]
MFVNLKLIKLFTIVTIISITGACTDNMQVQGNEITATDHLTVYKNANCKCCDKWILHMKDNGFNTISQNLSDLSDIKEKFQIHPKLRSCHTATKDGFVFEGHIPAKFIQKFLDEKPKGAKGLSVPAMPTGTPGMEFGDMLQPYKIYLLKVDGTIEIYAEVNSAEEQI